MIKIEITGENPLEVLASMSAYAMYCLPNDAARNAANAILEREASKQEAKIPNACDFAPVVPSVPHPAPSAAPVMPPPTVTPAIPPPTANPTPAPTPYPATVTTATGVGQTPAAPINPAPPVVPVTPAPSFTIDQIATAGAALVQAGKMPDLMALLGQFGVQAVTELMPEQLGSFATALRGLGANI